MMQQSSSPAWFGIGILAILALGLAVLALIVVVTVIIASGGSAPVKKQLKSAGLFLLIVVPALALVGLIGAFFTVRTVSTETFHVQQQMRTEAAPAQRDAGISYRETVVSPRAVMTQHRQPTETTREATVHYSVQRNSDSSSTVLTAEANPASPPSPIQPQVAENPASNGSAAQPAPSAPAAPVAPNAPVSPAATVPEYPAVKSHDSAVAASHAELTPHPDHVLRVRETLPGEPDWAKTGALPSDPGVLVPLSSQRFATLAEAEEQVTAMAVRYLKTFYRDEYPLPGDWSVPVSMIDQHAVKSLVGEEFDQDFGNGIKGKMYRAHLRLDLNSKVRQALQASWHDQIVNERLTMLGSGLGMVTVLLAASAGYFRLNEMTSGRYGGRLKLAAVALIGAAGLGVLAIA